MPSPHRPRRWLLCIMALLASLLLAPMAAAPASAGGGSAPKQHLTCEAITVDYKRPLVNGDHINLQFDPGAKQVNAYVDRNIQDGYDTLGIRFSDGTTQPLTKEQVNSGKISWDYSKKIGLDWFKVTFVQTNQTDTWPNLECGKKPEPKSSALYIYKKVDSNKPASWENSGRQTLIKTWDGWSWTSTSPLPEGVCGPGWGWQQDQGKLTKDKWPAIVDRSTGEGVLGWPPVVDAKHGELSELVAVPDCEKPKPDPIVETVNEQRSTCEAGVESREGTKTTDWIKQSGEWVLGEPTTAWGDWTFVRDLTTQEKLELGCLTPLTPIAPAFDVADQCEERSFVGIPLQEGVGYRIDGEAVEPGEHAFDGTIVVTAYATSDVPLAEGDWSWTETAKYTECPPVVPEKPAPIVESRQWETSVCLSPLDGTRQVSRWHEEITTDWVWDEKSWAWVKGEPVSTGELLVESEVVEDESCAPAPKPTDPPTSKPTPTPQPTDSPTKQVVVKKSTPKPTPTKASPKGQLAQTGGNTGLLLAGAFVLAAGGVTLLIVRRRQASTD